MSVCVTKQLEYMELYLGVNRESTASLWIKIKGNTGKDDIVVGVCYRPPNEE